MINREHIVIVTDDPIMAAVLSSAFSAPEQYVPVYESPRMKRPDPDREITTMVNSMRRVGVGSIIYSRVDAEIPELVARFIDVPYTVVDNFDDLEDKDVAEQAEQRAAKMTNENASLELYKHCVPVDANNKLAVVIANTSEVDSVIAANYAIARNADFFTITIPADFPAKIVEKLNNISASNVPVDIRKIDLNQIKEDLTQFLPSIDFSKYSKVLFISEGVPFGIALPATVTAHLPKLKLGISIASNLGEYAISQHRKHAFNATMLINRELKTKNEEEALAAAMLRTQGLVKTEALKHAKLSELEVEVFPYDVLYIATHGGQVVASRETYEFKTDDGNTHEIVVDVGRGTTGEVHHIVSVDKVEKSSSDWTKVQGQVWVEYMDKVVRNRMPVTPVKKPETVMIQMRDLQFEPNQSGMGSGMAFNTLANGYSPLVIVNACGSWNEISGTFVFAGCTAFIGTLLPVLDSTAAKYGEVFCKNLFKDELINVAHKARISLSDEYNQSLYIFTGTFESKFDSASSKSDPNGIDVLQRRIPREIEKIKERIKELNGTERKNIIEAYEVHAYFLEQELEQLNHAISQTNTKD
jgi:hypothetical protein